MYRHLEVLTISPGVQETAGAATAAFAIPENAGGRARRVAVRVVTATETMYVLPVVSGSGAVTAETGIPVSKENPIVLNVSGFSHLAALRAASADVVFNITPIED